MLFISSIAYNYDGVGLILITIFLGEASIVFIKIIKSELSGGWFSKIIGFILLILVMGGCWYIIIILCNYRLVILNKADGMPEVDAD